MKVDAKFNNSVADQDDENRIAPAGFDVNGEETWKWTWHAALVRTGRQRPNLASVRRATAVNVIDAWQGMATHGERYQDLWPR